MAENQAPPLYPQNFLPTAQFYSSFIMSANPGYMTQQLPPHPSSYHNHSIAPGYLTQGIGGNFIDFASDGNNYGSSSVISSESDLNRNAAFGSSFSGNLSPGETGFEVNMIDDFPTDSGKQDWMNFEEPNENAQKRRNFFSGTPYARPQGPRGGKGNWGMNRNQRGQNTRMAKLPSLMDFKDFKEGPTRCHYGNQEVAPTMGEFTVMISGLPPSTSEAAIGANFSSVGTIKLDSSTGGPRIYMQTDPTDGSCLGNCIIVYGDLEGAQSAVTCFDGKEFQGNVIRVMMNPNDLQGPREAYGSRMSHSTRGGGGGKAYRGVRDVNPPARGGSGGRSRGSNRRGGNNPPRCNNNTEFREGDWDCYDPQCGNRNFAWREECHRCGLPRSSNGIDCERSCGGRGGGARRGRGNPNPERSSSRRGFSNNRGLRGVSVGGGRSFGGGSRGRSFIGPY